MGLKRLSEPAFEPVTLDEAKDHLNFTSDDKDALIEGYISAARGFIENSCHIVVAESEWQLTYDAFPDESIAIPKSPLIGVAEVAYDDEEGDEQTLDEGDDYVVDASQGFGWVVPVGAWPATVSAVNAVRVSFTAGWPNESTVSTAPQALKQAMLLLIGHFFENRGAPTEMPPAVEALISPFRVPVLA